MTGGSSTSLALTGDLDLGSLTLDLSKGAVEIPEAKVKSKTTTATSGIQLSDLNNYKWTMTCVPSGNPQMDADCEENFDAHGGAPVFMRVFEATKSDGSKMYGLGVWESPEAYNGCGGIDMNDATVSDIQTGDHITFTTTGDYALRHGGSYDNWNTTTCPRRGGYSAGPGDENAHEAIQKYNALAPLVPSGNGYSLTNSTTNGSGGCTETYTTSVTFTPGANAGEIYGLFQSIEAFSAGCTGKTNKTTAGTIKAVRGDKVDLNSL